MDECGWVCQVLKNIPEVSAWVVATFTFLGLTLRALADFLAWTGAKIGDKATSDFGAKVSEWAMLAARIVGWFGGGISKRVLEDKIKEAGK